MPNMFLGFPVSRAKIADMISGAAPPLAHVANHRPPGSDPLVLPADIATGQVVGWNGTKFVGVAGGAGIASAYETPGVYISSWFDSKDGWEVYASANASVTLNPTELAILVTASASKQAYVRKAPSLLHFTYSWAHNILWTALTRIVTGASHKGTLYILTGYDDLARHVGFKMVNGLLMASVADGTTETLSGTLLDLSAGAQSVKIRLAIDFTPARALFYIDDALVATIDTGLPTGTSKANELFYVNNKNDANAVYCLFEISYLKLWKSMA